MERDGVVGFAGRRVGDYFVFLIPVGISLLTNINMGDYEKMY